MIQALPGICPNLESLYIYIDESSEDSDYRLIAEQLGNHLSRLGKLRKLQTGFSLKLKNPMLNGLVKQGRIEVNKRI